METPEIIGLVEVENQTVLEDLVHTTALKDHKYAFTKKALITDQFK